MPTYIVKPVRDRDEYVVWSTIVDAPIAVGTRAELAPQLLEMYGYQAGDPARFERADEKGTSALGNDFGWDDRYGGDVFWLGNTHWDPGPESYQVRRANLAAYARADIAEDTVTCLTLVEPYEDEDDA